MVQTSPLSPRGCCHVQQPVYLEDGELSQTSEGHNVQMLASLFLDMWVEVSQDHPHFNPPHRAKPEQLSLALCDLWQHSEEEIDHQRIRRSAVRS